MQDHVLCRDAVGQLAIETDAHSGGLFDDQCFCHKRMLSLGRADAPGQCPDPAHGASVAVGADQRYAGHRNTLFRRDDVDDSLSVIVEIKQLETCCVGSSAGRFNEFRSAGYASRITAAGSRIDNVVHRAKNLLRVAHVTTLVLQAL